MLQQINRFHGHGSLRYVYKSGQAVRSSLAVIKYVQNPRRRHSRFSVVISKKVLKSAVRRNRVRRRIYEIIRHELPNLKPKHDLAVIIVSPDAISLTHGDLKTSIKQLLSQADLYL